MSRYFFLLLVRYINFKSQILVEIENTIDRIYASTTLITETSCALKVNYLNIIGI